MTSSAISPTHALPDSVIGDLGEPPIDTSWVRHIAFFTLSALGDFVLSLPLIQATRAIYPQARVTIICGRGVTAGLAREMEVADEVLLLPAKVRRSPLALWQGLSMARTLGADIALQTFASHGTFGNLIVGATQARIRCGFSNGRLTDRLTHRISITDAKHYITLNMDLLRRLGHMEAADPTGRYLPPIENKSVNFAPAGLAERFGKYAVISISSDPALSFKRWPVEKWIYLARALTRDGIACLFVGGPADADDIATIFAAGSIKGENLAGKTNFSDVAAIISQSLITIGTDGLILHLAAAMDLPCVGIFGATNPHREGPWRQADRAALLGMPCSPCYTANTAKLPLDCKTQECLHHLPAAFVYQKAMRVLAEVKDGPRRTS